MFGELFGRYLVEEKIIDDSTLSNLLKEQAKTRVKLGMMAVAEGLCTKEQADEINRKQQKEDKRFGDIAIESGILSEGQLEKLLEKQGSPYMKFIQILVDETDVESFEIDGYLENFRKKWGFDESEFEAVKNENVGGYISAFVSSSQPYISNIAGQTLRNMIRFVTSDFYIDKLRRVDEIPYEALAIQHCHGDHSIYIGLMEPEGENSFITMAEYITGDRFDSISAIVYDSIGEFINAVSGLIITELASERLAMEITPQSFYEKQVIKGHGYVLPIFFEGKEIDLYISIDSDINVGSTPLDIKVQVDTTRSEGAEKKPTVVIVDDSGWSRTILRNLLEKNGFAIVGEAGNGSEAIEVYKKCRPDVITLDITMPTMDGIEALRHIMEFDPSAKAAMITSAGQRAKVLESLKLGAEKFITKPFDPNLVLTELKSLVKDKYPEM